MPFDYQKEYREFYLPPKEPGIVQIPAMQFLAVRGEGDPNQEEGEYSRAIGLLYGIAFTIKMSYKGARKIEGYFAYTMPPLEGFWWQEGLRGVDYARKDRFQWIAAIRLPDFVQKDDYEWALAETSRKKKHDFSNVEFFPYEEGLCVQCMHIGPYDEEPDTIAAMEGFAQANGYAIDITPERFHHEIYLSDPRKANPAKLKTVLRHPIRKEKGDASQ